MKALIPIDQIQQKIHFIRGMKIMVDVDLAHLYGVPTKQLTQAVRRNLNRFPDDFMVRLTLEESQEVLGSRTQIVTLKRGHNVKYTHMAFTEEGIGMLSSVLRSDRAVQVNIMIVRAFIRLRQVLSSHKELALRLEDLGKQLRRHDRKFKKQDHRIKGLIEAIWELMNRPREPIGFKNR